MLASDNKHQVVRENSFSPSDLEKQIEAFVDYFKNHRYHESLANLTPADVYHRQGGKFLEMKEEIKKQTITKRGMQHQSAAT